MCLLAAPAALAASTLTTSYNSNVGTKGTVNETSNTDILAVSQWGYFWHLQDTDKVTRPDGGSDNAWAGVAQTTNTTWESDNSIYKALTTEGNTDYSVKLGESTNYIISRSIYVQGFSVANTGSVNLTYAEDGCITTEKNAGSYTLSNVFNFGTADVSLSITLNAENVLQKGFYNQTLIDGTIWNVNHISTASITLSNVDGINDGGLIYSKDGKYYANASFDDHNGWQTSNQIIFDLDTDTAYLVANIADKWTVNKLSALVVPEPATATLSLLALAGLASRRRRHN